MLKILILYYSRTGNTESIAKIVSDFLKQEGHETTCKSVEEATPDMLCEIDGLIIGSPTYYGTMAGEVKTFLDKTIKCHGKLDGKAEAAFATYANSGQETTLMSILEAMLVHGMVIQGDPKGHHYGVTCNGKPEEADYERCKRFAKRFSNLLRAINTT